MGRNTFCQDFEYDKSAEVYCTYENMVLQLDDCTKILNYINTGIDLIFLFDHYCVNDRGI